MKTITASVSIALLLAGLAPASHAALYTRLGGLAVYDTDRNITWLANANYALTSGYDADGTMTWAAANTWAAGLNVVGKLQPV